MRPQPENRKRKFHMGKGLRLQIYAWCMLVGVVLLVGGTLAWYTLREREAETEPTTVMKPYYLSLRNPDDTDMVQLSVGSLLQGKTKQIVFCVSSEEAQQINEDTTVFEYALELVHTDNLALKYEIYSLTAVDESEAENVEGLITTEREVNGEDGSTSTEIAYWQKTSDALTGTDVSAKRWEQAGLLEADADTDDGVDTGDAAGTDDGADTGDAAGTGDGAGTGEDTGTDAATATADIINRGTYISYEKVEADGETEGAVAAVDNGLELTAGADTAQYFVLEISWNITSGFEKYDKETDMIYLLAKALQPMPEESTP